MMQTVAMIPWSILVDVSPLTGKVAFITGGSRAGLALPLRGRCSRRAPRLPSPRRIQTRLDAAAAELCTEASSARVLALAASVRNHADVQAAIAKTVAHFGALDVLINNAGVGVFRPVADMSVDDWHRIMDTNVSGVFYCCHAALPYLKARGGGWIVNVSSLASKNPFVNGAGVLRLEVGAQRLQRSVDAGGSLRRHSRRLRAAGFVNTGFGGLSNTKSEWALQPDDVAEVILDLIAHPSRSLPSRVEIRPAQPPRK